MAKQTRPIKQPIRFPSPKQPVSLPERKAARADAIQRNIESLAGHYYLEGPSKGDMADARRRAEQTIEMLQMLNRMTPEEQDAFMWMTGNAADKASPHYAALDSLTTQFVNAKTEPARQELIAALWTLYEEAQVSNITAR
jgi:hypothetical protein